MRRAYAGVACLIALLLCGCASKDTTIARLEGSEPQRLSFGAPAAVQQTFAAQMKACWFDGPTALLSGYQYDTAPATLETANGLTQLPQITIQSGPGPSAQKFLVQFYPFNDNTLISTRNLSFPVDLAAKLKRDVETWIFGRGGCERSTGTIPVAASSVPPQTAAAVGQPALAGAWTTSQEAGPSIARAY